MRSLAILVLGVAACGSDHPDVDRDVGAQCDVQADCNDRCLTPSNEYPGGLCTLDCDTNDDCPSDTECAEKDGGVCLYSCFDSADCDFLGAGYFCQEVDLRGPPGGKTTVCRGD